MKNYIFITSEGFTFSPNCTDSEPDIENCQVLGFAEGINETEAFNLLIKNNKFLKELGYNEIYCYEIAEHKKSVNFSLNK